jgi:hypothetical protein
MRGKHITRAHLNVSMSMSLLDSLLMSLSLLLSSQKLGRERVDVEVMLGLGSEGVRVLSHTRVGLGVAVGQLLHSA